MSYIQCTDCDYDGREENDAFFGVSFVTPYCTALSRLIHFLSTIQLLAKVWMPPLPIRTKKEYISARSMDRRVLFCMLCNYCLHKLTNNSAQVATNVLAGRNRYKEPVLRKQCHFVSRLYILKPP